jgi:hypothetical protein
MGVWGEKCVRCGEKRTRSTYEGLPTCDDCQKLLEARLQADAEDHRLCPLDGVAMSKEIVLNVVVDRCPACKGMWLDGGELDLLKAGIEAGMAADLGHALFVPPF